MQPRNLPLAVGVLVLLEPLDDGADAEPHAASTSAALATAAVIIDLLNSYLLDEGSATLPKRPPALLTALAGQGRMTSPLRDCPKGSPAGTSAEGVSRSLDSADAKLRRLIACYRYPASCCDAGSHGVDGVLISEADGDGD